MQDLAQRRISNWLTFGGLGAALLYLVMTGKSVIGASVLAAVLAFALALIITVPGYVLKKLGAGDVKMMAALGLASDVKTLFYSFASACVLQVLWYVVTRGLPWLSPSSKMAFAPFLFTGFCLSSLLLMH